MTTTTTTTLTDVTTVPFMDLRTQYELIEEEILAGLQQVCESSRFALGPSVEAFEQDFARYCEAGGCVAVNSGTSALHLAMRCLDIGPGDEVITVPMTFVATAWAISYVGATPVFVDIDPVTRTMDPTQLVAAITPRTKAILPVHLYGQPADMDAILDVADAHHLPVVEDAAQAHGATYRGQRVGSLGRIGCFSFYPGKNLGAYGEGGALVTSDAEIADRARALRDHGQRQRYRHEEIGYNYRMDAFQGEVLRIKLEFLDDWNAARQSHAEHYRMHLADVPGLRLPEVPDDRTSVFHLYVVELDERDETVVQLKAAGIQTGLHYPIPVHLQPAYAHLRHAEGAFPHTEWLAQRCLSLPMYPELTPQQLTHVASQLASLLNSA